MKIEAGKYYKTRSGRRALVYSTEGHGAYPVHGNIEGRMEVWLADGSYSASDGIDSLNDLVGGWAGKRKIEFEISSGEMTPPKFADAAANWGRMKVTVEEL